MRPQCGMGFSAPIRAAPAPSGPPVILNGTFADTSHWTIASGGGAASMSITPGSPGTLNSLSGSGNGAATCTQTLSGLVSGQSYILTYDVTARVNGGMFVSLGSGVEVSMALGSVGTGQTVSIIAGATNQDIMVRPSSGIGGRTVSVTNLSVA